jgi:hypothetical protein
MTTYQWHQFNQSQRRRCREARDEWEKMNTVITSDLLEASIGPLEAQVAELQGEMQFSANKHLWDTIQQLRAEVKYLDNKITALSQKKRKKYASYE